MPVCLKMAPLNIRFKPEFIFGLAKELLMIDPKVRWVLAFEMGYIDAYDTEISDDELDFVFLSGVLKDNRIQEFVTLMQEVNVE